MYKSSGNQISACENGEEQFLDASPCFFGFSLAIFRKLKYNVIYNKGY